MARHSKIRLGETRALAPTSAQVPAFALDERRSRPAGPLAKRRRNLAIARSAVSGAHRRVRPARPGDQRRHRAQSRCADDRARSSTRNAKRDAPRSAARHPRAHQGQHRHRRQDADDGGFARPRRKHRGARRFRRRAAARGGRGHPRQDEPERVGELQIHALDERMERSRRTDAKSVCARPHAVRIELRLRLGDGVVLLRRRRSARRRTVRLRRQPPRRRSSESSRRWPRRAVGNRSDRPQSGHGGPDGAHGSRRGDPARRLAGVDPRDAATSAAASHAVRLHASLDTNALRGARIGVARKKFTGYNSETDKLFERRSTS